MDDTSSHGVLTVQSEYLDNISHEFDGIRFIFGSRSDSKLKTSGYPFNRDPVLTSLFYGDVNQSLRYVTLCPSYNEKGSTKSPITVPIN